MGIYRQEIRKRQPALCARQLSRTRLSCGLGLGWTKHWAMLVAQHQRRAVLTSRRLQPDQTRYEQKRGRVFTAIPMNTATAASTNLNYE